MTPDERRRYFDQATRVVVKAGSNILTGENGLNLTVVRSISKEICQMMERGLEVLFVSSGAMACGTKKMDMMQRPAELPRRQAVAAVGQAGLILAYEKAFARHGRQVAQILLTGDDLSSRKRYLNARNTLYTLLSWKVVPVINENDTVAVEEIKFGDNDNLAAMIALLMDAHLLINLTDIDGLFDKDPRSHADAKQIKTVTAVTRSLEQAAGRMPGALGTGGMMSKIQAAKKAACSGVPVVIANGRRKNILTDLFAGKPVGTFFLPTEQKLCSRKRWIAYSLKTRGALTVDEGAAGAIVHKGKSLLPGGITSVSGDFSQGAPVDILSAAGEHLGVGLVNYSAAEIRTIKGLKSGMIEKALGAKPYDEVIHRNNLVLV
ncbi:MAG: glutamate 5-kinase [Thermodesulfobacteriota bacterium]|nr:glutamate 5-kinase [Thermodesulfobacteriota bacterium]